MKRDANTYLLDLLEAGEHIRVFTQGMSLEDYSKNELVKAAVERKFAVIGEALVGIRESAPELLGDISGAEKIIGFRNVLVHGYAIIDDATVWSAIENNLTTLLEETRVLYNA
ncbi:MAG: DUF86 domain-containing protein [Candidatus Latescibacteria bacterium]|nr:DUF86 domain-containing protein [Candidatus Latescibacterota bacterium]